MNNILEYLKYLWRSTNQHGVHSPFVFELITRAMYAKKDYPAHPAIINTHGLTQLPPKYYHPLNRALYHLLGPEKAPLIDLQKNSPSQKKQNTLLYINLLDFSGDLHPEQLSRLMHDQQLLLVRKSGSPDLWGQLVQSEAFHLTIDCFRFGMVFKRPQQAKEHFTIRL